MRLHSRGDKVRAMGPTLVLGLALSLAASLASAAERVKIATAQPPFDPAASASTAGAGQDAVTVTVDHAKVVRLPARTQTVVVGNPMIADVTVQKNGVLVVTGKSYGVTNLIALDSSGNMLAESMISVQAASASVVTVQRGLERESYSCTPNCQPSLQLGDANKYFNELGGQAGQRNSWATQPAGASR